MPVTLKVLAAKLGMHPSTVSRALNDHPGISDATRITVRKMAADMGYEPNPVARGLVAGKTGLIAFIVAEVPGSFVPEMIEAANRKATETGHGTILSVIGATEPERIDAELERLRRKHLDGFLIHRHTPRPSPGLDKLLKEGFPVVFAGCRPVDDAMGPYVAWDELGGARGATEHMADLGYESIAYFGIEHPRAEGYREAIKARGLEETCIVCRGGLWQQGYRGAERLMALKPMPRAVVCFSDWIAFGLLARLQKEGIDVPGDMAVIANDDLWVSGLPQIRLSSVHHPRKIIGEKACDMLIGLMAGRKPESELIPGEVIVRGTCGGPEPKDDLGWWADATDTDF